jgi:hypothetical protein
VKRLLVLLLLAVPLACGDDDGDDDDGRGDVPGATSVAVDVAEPLRPGPVTWEVTLSAAEALELSFPDAQRAEVSLSRGGEVVYQWSRSQMFSQELGEESLGAGDQLTFELEDVLEVDPGEYELEASITATDTDLTERRTVTVEPR